MQKIIALLVIAFILLGCATVNTVKGAKGTGTVEEFNYPYDKVYEATIDALKELSIEIVEKNKVSGEIIGKRTASNVSFGERMAVFISALSPQRSKVEIISKTYLATNIFAKDWTQSIFSRIRENLKEVSN